MHDGEQIVAGHALPSSFGVRHDHERVRVPDDHRVGSARSSSSRISPSRLMLNVRGRRPSSRSGRCRAASSTSASCHDPTLRNKPAAALLPRSGDRREAGEGSVEHRAVLVVLGADQRCGSLPDERWRSRVRACSMIVGLDAALPPPPMPASHGRRHRRARRTRAVCRSTHRLVVSPSRMMTCIIASIIAMSVPGSGWMNWSASSAVIVRIGSITTSFGAVRPGLLDDRPQVAVGEPRVGAPTG